MPAVTTFIYRIEGMHMSSVRILSTVSAPGAYASFAPSPISIEQPTAADIEEIGRLPSDRDFVAMRVAYRATGGIARDDDLARLLEDHPSGTYVSLPGLVALGELFGFEWHRSFWIPMFQFDLRDLSIKKGARKVMAELASEFDGWSLATWFAHPNSWLNDKRPVDLLDSSLPAVLKAARADRFIAAG